MRGPPIERSEMQGRPLNETAAESLRDPTAVTRAQALS